ncbi:antibiotic biosynthesis monooxygenase [Seonamhaeicola algicola]|uniref:Antibiotic biosynthesis monooxygenase n=1 Tax=Seonamhaeicola algicola TaxID=1719036 RepID=A0A5C7AT49_9FLAO|nr:antibiotic biosynthesis monooxygenase [Seonamhaeicola algicola]TXE11858.1 antibiotic biosynthesis monooxygenase [Seonamhaeicola algicola]
MLVRIVKLGFDEKHIDTFLTNFETDKTTIRNFEGCNFLELYQDKNNPTLFFTYSYWDDEMALERYRNSETFIKIWNKTKVLFNIKPEAWSVHKLASLK